MQTFPFNGVISKEWASQKLSRNPRHNETKTNPQSRKFASHSRRLVQAHEDEEVTMLPSAARFLAPSTPVINSLQEKICSTDRPERLNGVEPSRSFYKFDDEGKVTFTLTFPSVGGDKLPIRISFDGIPQGFVLSFSDISDHRRYTSATINEQEDVILPTGTSSMQFILRNSHGAIQRDTVTLTINTKCQVCSIVSGFVFLRLIGTSNRLIYSTFDQGDEGWSLVNNRLDTFGASGLTFSRLNRAPSLNRYIQIFDQITLEEPDSNNGKVEKFPWLLISPPKFSGNLFDVIGSYFTVTIMVLFDPSTEYLDKAIVPKLPLVELHCLACQKSANVLRFYAEGKDAIWRRGAQTIEIALTEDEWKIGTSAKGRDTSPLLNNHFSLMKKANNRRPTRCELERILKNLAEVWIIGDITPLSEKIAVDNIGFVLK